MCFKQLLISGRPFHIVAFLKRIASFDIGMKECDFLTPQNIQIALRILKGTLSTMRILWSILRSSSFAVSQIKLNNFHLA